MQSLRCCGETGVIAPAALQPTHGSVSRLFKDRVHDVEAAETPAESHPGRRLRRR